MAGRVTVETEDGVENCLVDFDRDLYAKTITLEFYRFLRPEQKFASLDDLRTQIQADAQLTRKYFAESKF